MIVTVDGPAAGGKGTLARRLAERLGFAYMDTGLLYRAVGLAVLRRGSNPSDTAAVVDAARGVAAAPLTDPMLRAEETGQVASQVAVIPEVRAMLLTFQRAFASCPPEGVDGAVMDGRDVGTVVCPNAECKLFVTANLAVRARRRVKELRERGMPAIEENVLERMRERDRRDSERVIALLMPAEDAFILDTSEMDADMALARALTYVSPLLS
ncbi:Cytidylate kinase [invertebrate metagenome]|uniref:(d)CMP kinase n=1 Tax=invertebrate metagenome TaxID=1711999 RepID=A0A484H5P7_9ZZZZ